MQKSQIRSFLAKSTCACSSIKLIENDISMIKNGFLNFCIFQWKLHILRLCVKICQYKSILYFSIFHYRIAIFVFDKNRRIKIVHHFRFLFIKIKISYYITVKLVLLIEIKKKFYTIVYNKISKYNRPINKSYEWIDLLILSNTQMNGPPNIISRELFPRRALIFFFCKNTSKLSNLFCG